VDVNELSKRARSLGALIEPFAGQVYFSPECHSRYEALGFNGSPGEFSGIAMPDGPAYFCSRGALMGQVPGQVVSAAFAVFNPSVVIPSVDQGWSVTQAVVIEKARTRGAIEQLSRILGEHPVGVDRAKELLKRAGSSLRVEGKPLYAGVVSQTIPDGVLGAAWRYADCLREFRGDAHISSWTSAGFDAVEIGLLTELYWGLPLKTYIRTRAWPDEQLDDAIERLERRGLVSAGAFTEKGREEREGVELATDLQCRPIVESLGDRFDELAALLAPIGHAIRRASGYPSSGPHELAAAAQR
jgi:helix-turn-helix protein